MTDSAGQVGIRPFTLAIDTGNGMMGELLPSLLAALPCRVVPLFFEPMAASPTTSRTAQPRQHARSARARCAASTPTSASPSMEMATA